MKRKKNACFKKKKIQNCVLLCDVVKRRNSCTIQDSVYTIQVSLLNPLQRERERIIGQRENGHKLVAQRLHLASLQVFHNQSVYSGNLECMSIQRSAARRRSGTDFISSWFLIPRRIIPFCSSLRADDESEAAEGEQLTVGYGTNHTHLD